MSTEDHKQHDDESEKSITDIVEKHGWFVGLIKGTDYLPTFGYTIGLWKNFKHPELVCFGLDGNTIHQILNIGGRKIKDGERLITNKLYDDFFEQGPAQFVIVKNENIKDYFGYGMWFYEYKKFDALQLVWPDRSNLFPWESEFDESFIFRQPLLDRNTDFKFLEKKDRAAITNRQHLEENKPIKYVIHEKDGDWQFLTGDDVTDEDIKWVALKEMVVRDFTLNELFNLDKGEYAEREFAGGQWTRKKLEE